MVGAPLTAKYSLQLGFSFDTHLGENLEFLRKAVLNQDFDAAILVDGKEGAGKSVLAMQVACLLDCEHSLDLKRQVCFTPDAFKDAVGQLGRGKSIVWDEARRGLNRRRFASDVNLEVTDMLAECRQHNLFLIIVMPSFYDMDLNVAVHRTRALIHVYYDWLPAVNGQVPDRPLNRGFFRFYNEEGKKQLYTNKRLRQGYEYPYLKNHSFDSKFINHYVVDEREYRRMKWAAEQDYRSNQEKKVKEGEQHIRISERGAVLRVLRQKHLLVQGWAVMLGEHYGISERGVRYWLDRTKEGRESE